MITIKQQAELSYHHVDVKDAVVMAPVMNRLYECLTIQQARVLRDELPEEERQKYNRIHKDGVQISYYEAKSVFDVLSSIGFVATDEYSPEEVLASYLKKD